MGERGAESGFNNENIPAFQGSEKQVKWANDITEKFLKSIEDDIKRFEKIQGRFIEEHKNESRKKEFEDELERYKTLMSVISDIVKKLPLVLSASEMIGRRYDFREDSLRHGLRDVSDALSIYVEYKKGTDRSYGTVSTSSWESEEYDLEEMKNNIKLRNDFVKETLEHLKEDKHNFKMYY
ncbi:MAG: hypothetical protein K1W34_14080 [Lachnospiraceae bacterium]